MVVWWEAIAVGSCFCHFAALTVATALPTYSMESRECGEMQEGMEPSRRVYEGEARGSEVDMEPWTIKAAIWDLQTRCTAEDKRSKMDAIRWTPVRERESKRSMRGPGVQLFWVSRRSRRWTRAAKGASH